MIKPAAILALLGLIVALPFLLRPSPELRAAGDEVETLVIVTPHNEAIRQEFARGFSKWYGKPVRIEWRALGGTTEILRYLPSEYASAARAWWPRKTGKPWPAGASESVTASAPPSRDDLRPIFSLFRDTDNHNDFTSQIDLFFGGGEFDHSDAFRRGLTVAPWPSGEIPKSLFASADGQPLMPEKVSGETWRSSTFFGNAVSTFGICYNFDRLRELGVRSTPRTWDDLADPVYFHQLAISDPDKSGSVAKAFEMIVHQKIYQSVRLAGFDDKKIAAFEAAPKDLPKPYQDAVERGWEEGIHLIQLIGANARYFTDSSSKVSIDVAAGDAAVGMSIDFYARFEGQMTRSPDGTQRIGYITPAGGSSVSCDPISLLRGAPSRALAVKFIEFVLSEEGQRLWTYKAGSPGGPEKYTLRRLPIRRDFYPSTNPAFQPRQEIHRKYAAEDLADPAIDPYQLSTQFIYYRRWTGDHFSVQRKIIKAMCIDSGDELREAWLAIKRNGGPRQQPAAMAALSQLPSVQLYNKEQKAYDTVPLNWRTAPKILKQYDPLDVIRLWTAAFRANYDAARKQVKPFDK